LVSFLFVFIFLTNCATVNLNALNYLIPLLSVFHRKLLISDIRELKDEVKLLKNLSHSKMLMGGELTKYSGGVYARKINTIIPWEGWAIP
jgi:hypothetical protein